MIYTITNPGRIGLTADRTPIPKTSSKKMMSELGQHINVAEMSFVYFFFFDFEEQIKLAGEARSKETRYYVFAEYGGEYT